ncbi:MerR family transcriptional regulator [Paenibacillus flagellatus]|uniref:Transcriptional regulator n=1 Tax=Paenibacillus flagellatus TaxID=2211139 RepID=A0A2V5K897_9BACL|nr:MerR family transcriptional regulator [Paenibacillus flagellatus]PYI55719.1 transcriptional regulator [Paenibacillus flagellatus]
MQVRPIDVARKLNVSTSALRHYEEWGIVPPIERAPNGYRVYTEEHIAYFECIRAMNTGYGMTLTKEVMRLLQRKEADAALWKVNEAQAALHRDKTIAEKTIEVLETKQLEELDARGRQKWMTIGEVSEETNIPASAIRHWEKMGLLTLPRDPENGYRRFNRSQVRQILIIRTLRSAVYSLDIIKRVIKELDHNNVEQARKIARDSLEFLNRLNRNQLRGAHYLYRLCRLLHLVDDHWEFYA